MLRPRSGESGASMLSNGDAQRCGPDILTKIRNGVMNLAQELHLLTEKGKFRSESISTCAFFVERI